MRFAADLSQPIRRAAEAQSTAFSLPLTAIDPVNTDITGAPWPLDTRSGAPVNCESLAFCCAHSAGTHSECVGHILKRRVYVDDVVRRLMESSARVHSSDSVPVRGGGETGDSAVDAKYGAPLRDLATLLISVAPEPLPASRQLANAGGLQTTDSYPAPHIAGELAITIESLERALARPDAVSALEQVDELAPRSQPLRRALVVQTLLPVLTACSDSATVRTSAAATGDSSSNVVVDEEYEVAGNRTRDWSGGKAPYWTPAAAKRVRELGFGHVVSDLPSMDREQDDGMLASHRAFWGLFNSTTTEEALNNLPAPREAEGDTAAALPFDMLRTITELAVVPGHLAPSAYLLDLQVTPLRSDAAPTRPILLFLRSDESETAGSRARNG